MHKLIISLLVVLVFVSCQTEADKLAQQRQKVVNLALTSRDAVDAKWEDPELLVITLEQGSNEEKVKIKNKAGDDIYVDNARSTAVTFASFGMSNTGLPVCVKVVYPDGQELAYKCYKDLK